MSAPTFICWVFVTYVKKFDSLYQSTYIYRMNKQKQFPFETSLLPGWEHDDVRHVRVQFKSYLNQISHSVLKLWEIVSKIPIRGEETFKTCLKLQANVFRENELTRNNVYVFMLSGMAFSPSQMDSMCERIQKSLL